MKKEKVLLLLVILMSMTVLLALLSQAVAQSSGANVPARDSKLIKIMPEFEDKVACLKLLGFYIDPPTSYIKRNSIVVWVSHVPNSEVQISFQEGKTCRDVCASPDLERRGWCLDSKGCFVTTFLPYSSTTTLQFMELGTYDYKIISEDGKMTANGRLVVTN